MTYGLEVIEETLRGNLPYVLGHNCAQSEQPGMRALPS